MQTDMGKCTSEWTNNSEHCHYVNLMFEGFFAEVLTSFSKGISGVGFELGIILQTWHSTILMF